MPTLLEVQRSVGASLTGGGDAAAGLVIGDGIAADARLNIYRNTYAANLVSALRISYPAIRLLIGEDFFEGAARVFIDAHPPQSAYLNSYGAEFGDFLAEFPPAASLSYLADVARLEWAVNIALHAEDFTPLDAKRLLDLPQDADTIFVPGPSVTALRLTLPADAIWRAVIGENDDALGAIDLFAGPVFLIVGRSGDAVSVDRMDERDWRFAADLCAGVPLSRAIESANADMSAVLAALLAAGHLVDAQSRAMTNSTEGATP
jgi:hypothetical protein